MSVRPGPLLLVAVLAAIGTLVLFVLVRGLDGLGAVAFPLAFLVQLGIRGGIGYLGAMRALDRAGSAGEVVGTVALAAVAGYLVIAVLGLVAGGDPDATPLAAVSAIAYEAGFWALFSGLGALWCVRRAERG